MTKADKYENDVLTGQIKAGQYVVQAMQRHREDLKRPDLYFDPKPGEHAIKFISHLKHYKAAFKGKNFVLEGWQCWIISRLLGWKKKSDGLRRFNDLYLEVPRKNGKTSLLAALALYLLLVENEAAPEIYTAATKEEQAKILVDEAAKIAAESGLNSYVKVNKYNGAARLIQAPRKNGHIKPLGRDSDTLDGLNVFAGMIDEYHAHKDDGLVNVLKSGAGARLQPLICIITTAGFNKNLPAFAYRNHCINVISGGVVQDNLLAIVYTLDAGDDWRDPENWVKANPNYKVSVQPAYIKAQAEEAVANPSKQVNFKTKHLNIWTDADEVWIESEIWTAAGCEFGEMNGAPVYAGLDLASGFDFNSLVLNIVHEGKSYIKPFFWVPAGRVAQYAEINHNFKQWVAAGFVRTMPGEVMNWSLLANEIFEIWDRYKIKSLAYDRYKSEHGLIQQLHERGISTDSLDPFSQAVTNLNTPTDEFERRVRGGVLHHDKNPVLAWMLSNVNLFYDSSGNKKPARNDSKLKKIDGIVAAVMAIGEELTMNNNAPKKEIRARVINLNN